MLFPSVVGLMLKNTEAIVSKNTEAIHCFMLFSYLVRLVYKQTNYYYGNFAILSMATI